MRRRRTTSWSLRAVNVALGVGLVSACSSPRPAAPRADAAPTPTPAPPRGWTALTAWSPECPLYVPGPEAAPVPPVEWERCPAPVDPALGCRRMRATWRHVPGPAIAVFPKFARRSDTGRALLQFDRIGDDDRPDVRYHLVADADGPVRVAILHLGAPGHGCELSDEGLADDRYVFGVSDAPTASSAPRDEGALGGALDEPAPPRVLARAPLDPGLQSNWSVSSSWVIRRRGARSAWSWDGAPEQTFYDPARDPDRLPAHQTFAHGRDVFFEVGTSASWGVMVWDPTGGARPLRRWHDDATRAAGNFGTDGAVMVWTDAHDATPGERPEGPERFAARDVMVAPYTTDPAALARSARRLRADPGPVGSAPFVVGCGYAARALSADGASNDLLVVRLSDGAGWLLRGDRDAQRFGYVAALGSTCDEVFATAVFADRRVAIVRIPLARLGAAAE